MLSWRLHTGAEKAELQELNARLYDYVCRVRELERENLLLEEELRCRNAREAAWAEGQARFAEEAHGLRQQLDELSWTTALAEGECEALRRELRELQQLGGEERAARGRLDAELGAQRRELQEALDARAALEALLGRLQAERDGLHAAHDRDVRELRSRAASLTLHYRARAAGPAAPPPRLRELHDSFALLAAESWQETAQLYEAEVRELEEVLRRGLESRREAEEEARLCAQEVEALGRQALELEQLRARLEDELLRRREEYGLRAEELQGVIAGLEDEKAALTLAMADRLRDHQDLVKVKNGLSLEVATYRALLEGESNPEILVWTEHVESTLPELRSASYRCSDSVVRRENQRNLFARQKAALASSLVGQPGPKTASLSRSAAGRGVSDSGYSSVTTTRQEYTYGKAIDGPNGFRPFSPAHGLLRNSEARGKTFPDRPKPEGASDASAYLAKGTHESHWERRDVTVTGASDGARPDERTVTVGKKTEEKTTREQGRREKMFDSKEKASEERNLRWEELTKLDKEARKRESQQRLEQARGKEPPRGESAHVREVPISLQVSQDGRLPGRQGAGDSAGGEVGTGETRFRLGTSDASSSPQGESTTETIAENIVTSILKQFTQAPDGDAPAHPLPDTKVTYVGRKELPRDGKTKTEIVVESKLTEDVDVSDEAGLDSLLGQGALEVGLKGKSAERMISDIIDLGLKGREGRAKVVNVEIIEEPMSYVGAEREEEPPTPFQVEEVDDVAPSSRGLVEEEEGDTDGEVTFSAEQRQGAGRPAENSTHVEEVTEAGDSEGEQSYFVSTPDEHPGGQDRDEGSVYGQIHIEEESSIRYSWQDEIVPGTWRRRKRDGADGEKFVQAVDVPAAALEGDVASVHWKEQASGEFHVEPTVIKKEIKIPQEFRSSIKGVLSKEPREQMVEVIGQLEETLPARMREELSALTREAQGEPGSVSVDVRKVQASGGGSVTLLAEVNLSQTVDADQLDLEELSRDDDAGEIEKAVESVVRESLARRRSPGPGSPDRDVGDTRAEAPAAGLRFKRWATRELYSPSGDGADAGLPLLASQGPVSATVEVSSPTGLAQSPVLEDVSRSAQHVELGPSHIWRTEQVSRVGPAAGEGEVSAGGDLSQVAGLAGARRSVRHFTLGPQQSQMSQEVIFQGPGPAWQEALGTAEPGLAEPPADADRFGQQFRAEKEVVVRGSASGAGKGGGGPVAPQTSVSHIQLGPTRGPREHIEFTVPFSEQGELGVPGDSGHPRDEGPGDSVAIRHVRVGAQATEHTVFHGRAPGPVELSGSEGSGPSEGSADATQATRSYTVGRKVLVAEKSTLHRAVDGPGDAAGAEVSAGLSRSFRHIQLGPAEASAPGQLLVHAPVTGAFALAGSAGASEPGQAAGSTLLALGPKEASFTFQMAVSRVEADTDAHGVLARGARSDAGSAGAPREEAEERAGFDKTVQLQRMVDQRSVVSDEKKVALLYLDKEEEESDGHWF
ncbi:synemin isoform X1 [Oryctolagus cuniculus]|uniref:synemin isoform X1 n=1 Tax=Oryctolagus cuniculus TaxID=9986 RepID=UPI00387A61A2